MTSCRRTWVVAMAALIAPLLIAPEASADSSPATSPTSASSLWQVEMLADINPGAASSHPKRLTPVHHSVYFSASSPGEGNEPWVSDGKPSGTALIVDLAPGPEDSDHRYFAPTAGGTVFASKEARVNLWSTTATGGTAGETTLLKSIPGNWPSDAAAFGDDALMFTYGYDTGGQMWRTDGTPAGTRLVKGIRSSATDATSAGPRVFFTNDQNPLMVTDGTAAGTHRVRGWRDGPFGSTWVRGMTAARDGRVFFTVSQYRIGTELWVSNGSDASTRMVEDIRPGQASSRPDRLTPMGERMFFLATTDRKDREVWRTDGTRKGTVPVTDMTVPRVRSLLGCGDRLFFIVVRSQRAALWSTGGRRGDQQRVAVLPGREGAAPSRLTCIPGGLAFAADDGQHGRELWTLEDGGRKPQLHDLAPLGSSKPRELVLSGDTLFFTAKEGTHGREPWSLHTP